MSVSARLSRAKFTLFSHLGATGGAPHSKRLFFGDFHDSMMSVYQAEKMVNFDHYSRRRRNVGVSVL
jgi:hypothetical protein